MTDTFSGLPEYSISDLLKEAQFMNGQVIGDFRYRIMVHEDINGIKIA